MKVLAQAISGFLRTSALKLTSYVMVELLECSPRLKQMFMAKSYRREIERIRKQWPDLSLVDAAPAVHKCVDPLCPLCRRQRAEVN